ncbi:MAG: hypothetical protein ABI197_07475 [Granulicella sp.]
MRNNSTAACLRVAGYALWFALGPLILLPCPVARAQPQATVTGPHRTRLFLKDHSYQIVMSYRIQGDRVFFVSAERDGVEEVIPLSLIDFEATHRWEQEHPPVSDGTTVTQTPAAPPPTIDPELLKEELERRALTPEVAPDLQLPEQSSVLALDTFQGTPELVSLTQSTGDLNLTTGHSIVRSVVNPRASPHQIVQLRGERAAVQLHVNQPVFYLRIGDDTATSTGGTPLVVDTHGASSAQSTVAGNTADSQYAIVRTDVRQAARVIASFNPVDLGAGQAPEDVVETTTEVLPGGHWMKVTPRTPLTFGEYALMEIMSPREINLGVWDFGVHPASPENRDALKPAPKHPMTLERRIPD